MARGIDVKFIAKPVGKKRERLIEIRNNNVEQCAMVSGAPTVVGRKQEEVILPSVLPLEGIGAATTNPPFTTAQPLSEAVVVPGMGMTIEQLEKAALESGAFSDKPHGMGKFV